jgi:hypothetical protein
MVGMPMTILFAVLALTGCAVPTVCGWKSFEAS